MTTGIELDSMEEITADSIHNWIELLSHCLIQPRLPSCEKLFIMVKDVFCAALEKRVIWDKDLMTSFMRINIIQHCSELQRDVYLKYLTYCFFTRKSDWIPRNFIIFILKPKLSILR